MKDKNISQQINQSLFFNQCGQELKSIAQNSKLEQQRLRQFKRIQALRQQTQLVQSPHQKLLDNIVIDYLRSKKSNYSYSVVMRERNLISDEIKTKSQLLNMLDLNDVYDSTQGFDSSALELMLIKQGELLSARKESKDSGIQVQLISKDKTLNNAMLNELRIAEVRKSVEEAEKKHYLQMLSALKQQMRITIADQLKKEYQVKVKKLKGQYEGQVQVLKEKNKEVLANNPKLNPKIEQYLTQVQKLQSDKMNLLSKIKELQREKTTHNCLANQIIAQRAKHLQQQISQVQSKKKEYDLALKSIHTSVEELMAKKAALAPSLTQTDLFLSQHKQQRNNKDHMIEEIYGRMFVMDKRIQTISQDNQSLIEENRQLLSKVKQLQTQRELLIEKLKEGTQKEQKMAKYTIKLKTKEIMVGVTEQDIHEALKQKKYEHAIDQDSSLLDSEQEEQQLRSKEKYKTQVQSLTSQMKLLKNRLRFMVEHFQ